MLGKCYWVNQSWANFIQYLGYFYTTKYHVQLPNERLKKVGHMILGKSMLGKFCPTIWSLLPNLLGNKVMNIHRLIHVRARLRATY